MFFQLSIAFILFILALMVIKSVIGNIFLAIAQTSEGLDIDTKIAYLNIGIWLAPYEAEAYLCRAILLGSTHRALPDYRIAAKLYKERGDEFGCYLAMDRLKGAESDINEQASQYKKVSKSIDNEAVTFPHHAIVYLSRGNNKGISGDYEGALIEYSEAIRINPKLVEAYIYRGIIRSLLEDHIGAINDFNEVLRMKPDDQYSYRGIVFAAGTVPDLSQNQVMSFDPNQHNYRAFTYNRRGIEKGKLGDHRVAISDFTEAIRINGEDAEVYTNRGISNAALGNCEDAIADYNQAISINPNLTEPYTNRGYMKCGLQDYQGAIADFTQTIRINSDSDEGYNNRGIAKYLSGDKYGALADYDQGIRIKPNDGETYNNRGIVKSELGDFAGAIVDLRKAAEIFKAQGNPEYQNVLKRINDLS